MGGDILQLFLSGLAGGSIYALIAVGFVTIYNVTGVVNFAQGEFVMVGGISAAALVSAGMPLYLACIFAVIAAGGIGVLMQRLALHPARFSSEVILIIITIGFSTTMRGIALLIFGSDPRPLPEFIAGAPVSFLGSVIPRQDFVVVGVAIILMILLYVFFERTILGSALRACMMNREVSRLMGISPSKMALLSVALSALLAGIVGIVTTPITLASYDMGLMIGLKGFVAATLGGLISIPGAVLGGVILGVMESLGAGLISSGYKDAIAFLILLIVLILRPEGLLGNKSAKRV
jgi:branched-chain amino acid transport system permease protein